MTEVLEIIKSAMKSMGLNYDFLEYKKEIQYPYFVGEYSEGGSETEDGLEESTVMLTGFSRTSWSSLEDAKETIKSFFDPISGHTEITQSGSGVAIFYSNSSSIPTGDAELKKMQINLSVKKWKV